MRPIYRSAWLTSVADSVAGPLSVPEKDYAMLGHHVRDSDEMPIVVVAFIEGVLDLLHDVGVLVHRELLGIVAPVLLACHTLTPFAASWRLPV